MSDQRKVTLTWDNQLFKSQAVNLQKLFDVPLPSLTEAAAKRDYTQSLKETPQHAQTVTSYERKPFPNTVPSEINAKIKYRIDQSRLSMHDVFYSFLIDRYVVNYTYSYSGTWGLESSSL